jgi:short-subunit dehydrogenase
MKKILITGASEGIGLALAKQLASEGNLVTLVARHKEKLENALQGLPGDGHSCITADLSKKEEVHRIAEHIAQNHFDVLINNAGVGMYGRFDQLPYPQQVAMMQLNMIGLTVLSHSFLAHAQKGDSLVNIASTLGATSFPGQAVYAATKAYVLNFSESLWWENKARGVYVLGFCPGVTATHFNSAAGGSDTMFPKFITQTPEQVARECVAALKKRRKPRAVSSPINRSLLFLHRFLSRRSVVKMMSGFSPLKS